MYVTYIYGTMDSNSEQTADSRTLMLNGFAVDFLEVEDVEVQRRVNEKSDLGEIKLYNDIRAATPELTALARHYESTGISGVVPVHVETVLSPVSNKYVVFDQTRDNPKLNLFQKIRDLKSHSIGMSFPVLVRPEKIDYSPFEGNDLGIVTSDLVSALDSAVRIYDACQEIVYKSGNIFRE